MPSTADLDLDALIAEITKNVDDDAASMAAFHEAIAGGLKTPALGVALGERVQVEAVEFESVRRGIVARVRKEGRLRSVSLLDIELPGKGKGAKLVAAYQRWVGVQQQEAKPAAPVTAEDEIVEAAVLKVGEQTARLRPLGADEEVTLRSSGSELWRIVPGQIVTVKPTKRWSHRNYQYMSGTIELARVDIAALGLKALSLKEFGVDYADDGEPYGDELIDLWKTAVAKPKMSYEMEQILPGAAESDWEDDPITDAIELRQGGDHADAEKLLMDLLHVDLRCIDAHAHLGNWSLDSKYNMWVEKALAHYEVGIGIVEQALGPDFDGFLPWGMIDNRPFLRCLHGYGLALWRLGHRDEALKTFERICCLNPMDNTGARFCWYAVKSGKAWEEWDDGG